MDTQPEALNVSKGSMLALIEHFKGKPVNQDVLIEYCNLNKIGAISEGQYQDFLYQYNHDKRIEAIVPDILAAMQKYRPVPTLIEEAARNTLIDSNETISVEICSLMEKHGILYTEIDLICDSIGGHFKAMLYEAGVRANNMAATMLAHTAKEKYGDPLTVKVLGEAYRSIAVAKGKAAGL